MILYLLYLSFQQVRQGQPQFTGRRRRDASDVSKMIETSSDVDGLESSMSGEFDNPNLSSEKNDLADALPSMKEFLNQYTFIDERSARELEDQVVDRIEVTVSEEDETFDDL
ncbi:uncharacterized protein TNIN_127881 [Trichonephila inaurata madagascariensis]|uniref:Uncharacterized protein n=1 Tax=Trichonephila inaurata madagascariensis TaxID=2747483 RepID=A0A8X7CUR5_9ARAC|nr:uncharacterized protein TNIN_127881 [Trichonephila inaurata madagascariensis]